MAVDMVQWACEKPVGDQRSLLTATLRAISILSSILTVKIICCSFFISLLRSIHTTKITKNHKTPYYIDLTI